MLNKPYQNIIRSAKPTVKPDAIFVERLSKQLQQRAEFLPNKSSVETQHKKPWFLFGTLGVGTLTVVLAALVIVPQYFIKTKQLSGYVQKGPFISGSTITIQELDKQLQPTGRTYQTTTRSDFGDYYLTQKIKSDYIEIIAQGFYYNEVSGSLSEAPLTLRALAEVIDAQNVNVNVLTTLTGPRILYLIDNNNLSFFQAKNQAEQEVLQILKINESSTIAFEAMNISQSGQNNGILLAASVILQGQLSVAELSELLSKLSLDVEADGIVNPDSALFTTLQNNATNLNTYNIKQNLTERFKIIGKEEIIIPNFVSFVEPLLLNSSALTYRLSLDNNIFPVNHSANATITLIIKGDGFVENQEEVILKNLFPAKKVTYIDDQTLQAEIPIEQLSSGSYIVRNNVTGRMGVTDGEPIESEPTSYPQSRLIL